MLTLTYLLYLNPHLYICSINVLLDLKVGICDGNNKINICILKVGIGDGNNKN